MRYALDEYDAALTTTAKVKAWIGTSGTSEDARIAALIIDASAGISQYCGRKFASGTITDEIHDGLGGGELWLRRWPIASISSLYVDSTAKWASGSLLTQDTASVAGHYRIALGGVEQAHGRVDRLHGSWGCEPGSIKVTYVAGYSTIPAAVEAACNVYVAHLHAQQQKGAFGQVTSETLPSGGGSATYVGAVLPPAVAERLSPFVRVQQW